MKNIKTSFTEEELLTIGTRIAASRIEKGYKSKYVAELIRRSPLYYSRIESGAHLCSIETLVAIASALDLSIDYILYGETKSKYVKQVESMFDGQDETKVQTAMSVLETLFG